jgi:nitrite reductase/ring-hydroxylating ferredoxin subunit
MSEGGRTRICALADLAATGCFEFARDADSRDTGFVLRQGDAIRAYVNACAHLGVPLNLTGNNFFDSERNFLVCSMHGARFRPLDGFCVSGPCAGESLRPLGVAVDGDAVWLVAGERGKDRVRARRARRLAGAAFAAALAFVAGEAGAVWDAMRWGYAPEQVIAAARGQARRNEDMASRRVEVTGQPRLLLRSHVIAERKFGDSVLTALFWFDERGRLTLITEEPAEGDMPANDLCATIEAEFDKRYGQADLVTEKGETKHVIWRDEKAGLRIHFRVSAETECSIDYRQLRGPLDR